MTRAERIISRLQARFAPRRLQLSDDSARHAGHSGARPEGETHFHLLIEAEAFSGLSKIQRHQAIYEALGEEFVSGLHALSIEALAPED